MGPCTKSQWNFVNILEILVNIVCPNGKKELRLGISLKFHFSRDPDCWIVDIFELAYAQELLVEISSKFHFSQWKPMLLQMCSVQGKESEAEGSKHLSGATASVLLIWDSGTFKKTFFGYTIIPSLHSFIHSFILSDSFNHIPRFYFILIKIVLHVRRKKHVRP